MKSTWKRVLSAMLTVAMIATLLVVPAAAAQSAVGDNEACFVQNATNTGGIDWIVPSNPGKYFNTTATCPVCGAEGKGIKSFESSTKLTITPPDDGTLVLYYGPTDEGTKTPTLTATKTGETTKTTNPAFSNNTLTFAVTKGWVYELAAGSSNKPSQTGLLHAVFTPAQKDPTIELDQTSVILNASNSTATLNATVENSTESVTWTTSDNAVATVEGSGDGNKTGTVTLVNGVTSGTATITATLGSGDSAPKATCTVTVSNHTHNWGTGEVSKAPTCTAVGERTYTCTGEGTCPDGTKKEEIPALGHTWEDEDESNDPAWVTTTQPTCGQPGIKTQTCGRVVGSAAPCAEVNPTTQADENYANHQFGDDHICSVCSAVDESATGVQFYRAGGTANSFFSDIQEESYSGTYVYNRVKNTKKIKFNSDTKVTFTTTKTGTILVALEAESSNSNKGLKLTTGTNDPVTKDITDHIITFTSVPAGTQTLVRNSSTSQKGLYIAFIPDASTEKDPSAAPKFATGGDAGQVQKDGKVTFTLASDAPQGASYKLYNAATEGAQMGANAGVIAADGKITFTLTDGQLTGTDNVTWYVSATEVDTPESTTRTAVTVKPYIPVTSVSLVHFTTTDPGTGESHEPDHAGTVGHVLYEKMKETDADLIGPGEDGAELPETARPNGWKLVAVVKPDNATNKEVVFSNVRVTPEFINVAKDGTVTAIKAGTGRIRVSSVSEPDITAAFDLTVMVRISAVEIQNADGTAAATTLAMGKTLPLKAVVTASASASASHQAVTWSSSDETVATVSATGVVTPVKAGTVKITATSNLDKAVKAELELTVTKGTPELAFTTGNPQVTSGGAVRFKLTGVPAGVTPTFTVEQNCTEVNTVTVEALENDDNYNYKATMPANATGAPVTYTVTAKVAADANWNAAEKSVEVAVLDASAKNIFIVSPGTTKAVELTKGGSAKLEVIAQVNGAGQVKDDAATAALTYAWTKDGTAMSDTTYAITVDAAGEYVCTVTSTDTAVVAKQVAVTFTVTVVAPAMTTIDVTADSGVDYNAATGALKITGPVDATFTVTTGPDGHEDTVATPTSSTPSVARVSMTGDKLTITPWSVGTTVITLQGTKATGVKKEITVTVVKAPAPAALTESDYTVTQPTTEGGKGTITITQNAPAGTEYVYRLGDDGAWIKFPADTKSIEVAPGVYKIRVRVPRPELQETTNGVAVEIKAFTAAPTVSTVRVSSPADSVTVGATVQMTAEVRMSDNTISKTETVTWSVSDATVADISAAGLVTGLKAGTSSS